MNYYILTLDISAAGRIPQIQGMKNPPHYDSPLHPRWVPIFGQKYPDDLNVNCFEMAYHAKLTDIIYGSHSHRQLIISDKMYEVISRHKHGGVQVFNSSVEYRKKLYDYKFLHFYEEHNNWVDFKRSKFILAEDSQGYRVGDLELGSYEEYQELFQQYVEFNLGKVDLTLRNKYINISELHLDKEKITEDIFILFYLMYCIIVSEKLKVALEEAGLKGLSFTPCEGYKPMIFDRATGVRLQ
jgi:hypothetical protein